LITFLEDVGFELIDSLDEFCATDSLRKRIREEEDREIRDELTWRGREA